MQYSVIVIDNTPYCFWDWNLKEKNLEFIRNFDPIYFEYISNLHLSVINSKESSKKDKQYASIAIRNAYSHSLETLFAFIGATIQARDFVPGWLNKYKPHELYSFVNKIHHNKNIRNKLKVNHLSWQSLSKIIHVFQLDNDAHTHQIKDNFGDLWQRLASDFLNDEFRKEYNSIKHGYRAQPGGFQMAIGIEKEPGIPAPPERMQSLGGSDYGSSFFVEEFPTKDKNNIRLRNKSRNWIPENFFYALILIKMSLCNIKSFLQIVNGIDPETVKFTWPENLTDFDKHWKETPGVLSSSFDTIVKASDIKAMSKEEILAKYDELFSE